MRQIANKLDALIYFFIVPFGVLYVFPQFFLSLESHLYEPLPVPPMIIFVSRLLIYGGGVLAIWCAMIMRSSSKGSPVAFSKPTSLVCHGPYKLVRHPMMWALFITLSGEALRFGSPLIAVWLLIWIRFSIIYIEKYEEPYLVSVFKDEYQEYCRNTPRWLPAYNYSKFKAAKSNSPTVSSMEK